MTGLFTAIQLSTYTHIYQTLYHTDFRVGVSVTWSSQLMLAPLGKHSLPPLNPCNRARPERTPLLQEGASPPLPGHSPGWLSALFLALWKGLFFFFPGKGNIAQPPSGSPQTPSLTRTDGAPLSSRDPLLWPCPDPSLLGQQKPPPLSGRLPRSSGSSWAQRVCRGWGVGRGEAEGCCPLLH